MGREIELKIPLNDSQYEYIFSVITGKNNIPGFSFDNTLLCKIEKEDEYYSRYSTREESRKNGEPQVIRIRSEKEIFCGDKICADKINFSDAANPDVQKKSYFCIKRKVVENGIELNSENETFVENAAVIRDILELSGYIKFFEKQKNAISSYCNAPQLLKSVFHLELEIVNELKYIEVEVTDENEAAEIVRSALEKFVNAFGLNPSLKDSRSWMQILGAPVN
ncbi:MAG: hypothetical protein PUC37_12335 [Spirochaetales bacterium]|nr:hypothetical protein [Spirochaetales bacterium]